MEILSVASIGYVCLGLFVGFLSGFLGIGGGAAAVPILVFLGFDVKYAIGVSVLQMVFSSVYGSLLNIKNKTVDLKPALVLGIGGSVIIMPVLINFLNYDIKKAISTGLFFVIFSSISGFISLASQGLVQYEVGVLVGIGSLISVRFGVALAQKIDRTVQKRCLLALISTTLLIMINKLIG